MNVRQLKTIMVVHEIVGLGIGSAMLCMFVSAITLPSHAAPPSCATPAANFATLTSCRTATAAGAATPTATRTAGAVVTDCNMRVTFNVTSVNLRDAPPLIGDALGKDIGDLSGGSFYPSDRVESGWYHICSPDGWVAGNLVDRHHITAIAPVSTETLSVQFTPTRITTNTPIPAAERTLAAQQYGIQWCWWSADDPVDSPGVCSVFSFGSRFSVRVVPIQP